MIRKLKDKGDTLSESLYNIGVFKDMYNKKRQIAENQEQARHYLEKSEEETRNYVALVEEHFYKIDVLEDLKAKCGENTVYIAFCTALENLIIDKEKGKKFTETDAFFIESVLDALGLNGTENAYANSFGTKFFRGVGLDD
ncbi:hypothetical protein ACIQ34_13565 [Ureibacillus sp. NPDC094379]